MPNSKFKKILLDTFWKEINISGETFSLLRIRNFEAMIDAVSDDEFNVDERLPYWAELWPSALALAEFIIRHKVLFKDKRILELGCGLGLAGMAATRAGAKVLFSDYEEEALQFAQKNFMRNCSGNFKSKLLDWRSHDPEHQFDIIIAADVLYEKRFFKPLLNTMRLLLCPHGDVYIGEPNRIIAGEFFEMAGAAGFSRKSNMVEVICDGEIRRVTVHHLKRC